MIVRQNLAVVPFFFFFFLLTIARRVVRRRASAEGRSTSLFSCPVKLVQVVLSKVVHPSLKVGSEAARYMQIKRSSRYIRLISEQCAFLFLFNLPLSPSLSLSLSLSLSFSTGNRPVRNNPPAYMKRLRVLSIYAYPCIADGHMTLCYMCVRLC